MSMPSIPFKFKKIKTSFLYQNVSTVSLGDFILFFICAFLSFNKEHGLLLQKLFLNVTWKQNPANTKQLSCCGFCGLPTLAWLWLDFA